jgi:hypothetical protein
VSPRNKGSGEKFGREKRYQLIKGNTPIFRRTAALNSAFLRSKYLTNKYREAAACVKK